LGNIPLVFLSFLYKKLEEQLYFFKISSTFKYLSIIFSFLSISKNLNGEFKSKSASFSKDQNEFLYNLFFLIACLKGEEFCIL